MSVPVLMSIVAGSENLRGFADGEELIELSSGAAGGVDLPFASDGESVCSCEGGGGGGTSASAPACPLSPASTLSMVCRRNFNHGSCNYCFLVTPQQPKKKRCACFIIVCVLRCAVATGVVHHTHRERESWDIFLTY